MVFIKDNFIDPVLAKEQFNTLWDELDWLRVTRRREYWTNTLNRSYSYGKPEYARVYEPQPTHQVINYIRNLILVKFNIDYEGCFLNGYETNRDCLEWHADDDSNIDHSKPIAIVTLYPEMVATTEWYNMYRGHKVRLPKCRTIEFMPKNGVKSDITSVELSNGSLLLMPAGFQQTHLHRIPKTGETKQIPRISLTFRKLIS